jgi:hypothetical protein
MMIFMLVAIVFMIQVKRNEAKIIETQNKVKDIAVLYTDLRAQLYHDLESEFKNEFVQWRASLKRDLSIRFEGAERPIRYWLSRREGKLQVHPQQLLSPIHPHPEIAKI